VVMNLDFLSMWFIVRFLTHVYEKISGREGEPTLNVPQVSRRRLVSVRTKPCSMLSYKCLCE